jgi:hypothetical protein
MDSRQDHPSPVSSALRSHAPRHRQRKQLHVVCTHLMYLCNYVHVYVVCACLLVLIVVGVGVPMRSCSSPHHLYPLQIHATAKLAWECVYHCSLRSHARTHTYTYTYTHAYTHCSPSPPPPCPSFLTTHTLQARQTLPRWRPFLSTRTTRPTHSSISSSGSSRFKRDQAAVQIVPHSNGQATPRPQPLLQVSATAMHVLTQPHGNTHTHTNTHADTLSHTHISTHAQIITHTRSDLPPQFVTSALTTPTPAVTNASRGKGMPFAGSPLRVQGPSQSFSSQHSDASGLRGTPEGEARRSVLCLCLCVLCLCVCVCVCLCVCVACVCVCVCVCVCAKGLSVHCWSAFGRKICLRCSQ